MIPDTRTRQETVDVDGIAVRVMRRGTGSPLLLLNGLGASLEMWAPLADRLDGHELVAFDLPGAGGTPAGRWPLRMPQLAAMVGRLLHTLGYDKVDALGYSYGGIVAQELARLEPDRVDRLVLCGTSPGLPCVPPHPFVASLMLTPARYRNRRLAHLILPVISGGRTRRDPEALSSHLRERLANPPTTLGYLHQLYALTGWRSATLLREVHQPTLILHGSEDPLVPLVNARWMAWLMPNAQLHVVREGGHLFLLDEPESVIGVLGAFLTRPPHRPVSLVTTGRPPAAPRRPAARSPLADIG